MAEPAFKRDDLDKEAEHLLEEARMVLPGIQALFGFQLIAIFNQRFAADLSADEQRLHLAALTLAALSIALVMAPAAYHRQAEPGQVSQHFIKLATRLITLGMVPLMLGIVLDIYVVSQLVLDDPAESGAIAAVLLAILAGLWFVWPRWWKARRRSGIPIRR